MNANFDYSIRTYGVSVFVIAWRILVFFGIMVRFFFSDLYRFLRIARFAPLIVGVYSFLVIFPDQVPEVVLAYGKSADPVDRALPATAALYYFCVAIMVYVLELVLAHIDVRPYSSLNTKRLQIIMWAFILAVTPVGAMYFVLQSLVPYSSPAFFYRAQEGGDFFEVLSRLSNTHAFYIVLLLAIIGAFYWPLLRAGSSTRRDTNRVRRMVCFRFFPALAIGYVYITWGWLDNEPDRVVALGSLYFLHQFFLVWTVLFASVLYYFDRFKFPTITVFAIWWILINLSNCNDHHIVYPLLPRGDRTPAIANPSVGFQEHAKVRAWLVERARRAKLRNQEKVPVYLIAAQGGGLYAAYHAAATVSALFKESPLIAENVLAISTVSGGGMGSAVAVSLVPRAGTHWVAHENPSKWNCRDHRQYWDDAQNTLKSIFDGDFLAPVLTAGLFYDAAQQLIPARASSFDRSYFLEGAIRSRIRGEIRSSEQRERAIGFLDGGVRLDWNPVQDAPALYFNVTSVQTGDRQYVGPFPLYDNAGLEKSLSGMRHSRWLNKLLEDDDLSVIRAAGISARFPYFMPPATLWGKEKAIGRYVDGAYVDNSGGATLLDMIDLLREEIAWVKQQSMGTGLNFELTVVVLRNVSDDANKINAFAEAYTPIAAFFQTRVARGLEFVEEVRRRSETGDFQYNVLEFSLVDDEFRPGLGWLLSSASLREIERRVARELEAQGQYFKLSAALCAQ